MRGDEGAVKEVPGEQLAVPREPRAFDRAVEQFGRLAEMPAHHEDNRQGLREHRQQLSLPGGARDAQTTLAVRGRLVEAIQIHLRGAEKSHRLEADGELGVGHGVDQGSRSSAMDRGLVHHLRECAGESDRGRRRCGQRPVLQRLRDLERALTPFARLAVLLPEVGAEREVDHERPGLQRRRVVEVLERAQQPGVRLLVPAEQLLHAGAGSREGDAGGGIVRQ